MREQGATLQAVAAEFAVSTNTVRRWLDGRIDERRSANSPPKQPRGRMRANGPEAT
jgi:transposase